MSDESMPKNLLAEALEEHLLVMQELRDLQPSLQEAAAQIVRALRAGNKVFWCGNGGSAADSQHLAAELVGRFRRERKALASMALSVNSSILTAIGNDYGYGVVFRRQLEALGSQGDVLIGISTSGNSENVVQALDLAREIGIFTIAMTGSTGGRCAEAADLALRMPSNETARIQEAHIFCGHVICDCVESEMAKDGVNVAGAGA